LSNRFDVELIIKTKTETQNKMNDEINSNEKEINTISNDKKQFEKKIQDLSGTCGIDSFTRVCRIWSK